MSVKAEMESYLEELLSGETKKMKPTAVDALSTVTIDVVRGIFKAAAKDAELSSEDTVTEDHNASRAARQALPLTYPSLSTPDVTKCPHGHRYIVNHVLYICLVGPDAKRRILFPTGCTAKNTFAAKRINLGHVHKSRLFSYQCLNQNGTVAYKPISCMLGEVEISPGTRVKAGKIEYYCAVNHETGHMTLTQRKYLHNLCSLGQKNSSLAENDPQGCPGLTTSIYHSDYGSGSIVNYDAEKQILTSSYRRNGE
ncbi:hypothetical protein FO519_000056 [Halicephalobus sp. NKZ332]|nr:hypothetical protein FO519_000056 [Halicephalobus sp. NKZ332]